MAYREQRARELCHACRRLADAACPRCAAPCCTGHTPHTHRRCDACEMAYLSHETRAVNAVVVNLIVLAALLGGAGAFATHMARNGFLRGTAAQVAPLVPSIAGFLFLLAFAVAPWLRRRVRARFLRESLRPSPLS